MSFLNKLEVLGNISFPKLLMEQNEYWGTVEKGAVIKICAEADGKVLINGTECCEYTPCVGLNVYCITREGVEGEFRVNVICREPEQEAFSQSIRPLLHISPELFSLNDPNGLVFDEETGEYHLFFQCDYPGPGYKVQGDTKAWGHAISKDLISWQELPVAIPKDDNGVIWSGSAVIDKNNTSGLFDESVPPASRIVLLYTYYGGKNGLGGEYGQNTRQAAHMVLVGVGADHRFQFCNPLLLQEADHQRTVLHIAAVDEQEFTAAFQKGAVCLAHIQEVDRQRIRGFRRGCGGGGKLQAAGQQRQ